MSEEEKKYKEVECPYCHNKINYLVERQDAVVDYDYYGNGEYSKNPIIDDDYDTGENVNDYCCPICLEVIATNEDDADEFLQTGKMKK